MMKCILEQFISLQYIHAGKRKRRLIPNEQQKSLLETTFRVNYFPDKSTCKELALQTGLTERQVLQWFSRARYNAITGTSLRMRSICECIIEALFVTDYVY